MQKLKLGQFNSKLLKFWEAWELAPPEWLLVELVERELWSQASGDEHVALGTVQAGWRMCLHVYSQGSLLMLVPGIRTSLPCCWQHWTTIRP